MWLFIDTSIRGHARLALLSRFGRPKIMISHETRLNPVVLLDQIIRPRELASLRGICVVAGPGSFSAVRGGVLMANLLGRLLGKPLVGVSREDAENLSKLRRSLFAQAFTPQPYVAPVYDAEPNITCR